MATTKIENIVYPELMTAYDSQDFLDKNVFYNSGVAFADPRVTELMDATVGGNTIALPFYKPLDTDEPNVGSDDPDTKATHKNIDSGVELATKTYVNKSYSIMDLTSMIVGMRNDPMSAINAGIDGFWQIDANTRLLKAAQGIVADSVANHDGDLVLDISAASGTGEGFVDADTIIEATGLMGDRQSELGVIAMHSNVYNSLRKQQLIETVRDADNNTLFEVFGNLRVFYDDKMPVEAGNKYHTYIFGPGVFSLNYGNPGIASEIDRNPDAGNGMGETLLYSRRCILVHPRGYRIKLSTFASGGLKGLNYTQLATATTWERAFDDRKRIKFAAIISKG